MDFPVRTVTNNLLSTVEWKPVGKRPGGRQKKRWYRAGPREIGEYRIGKSKSGRAENREVSEKTLGELKDDNVINS